MTKEQARECVARGAARLDDKRPGWASRTDPGTLCIADCDCVLFQIGRYENAGYGDMAQRLSVAGEYGSIDGALFGFFVPAGESGEYENPSWRLLQDAWIDAIADRLVPATSVDVSQPQFAQKAVR